MPIDDANRLPGDDSQILFATSIQSHPEHGPKIRLDFGISLSFIAMSSGETEMLIRSLHRLKKKLQKLEAAWGLSRARTLSKNPPAPKPARLLTWDEVNKVSGTWTPPAERCPFWPSDEELTRSGPFCGLNSDISGAKTPCTLEFAAFQCEHFQEENARIEATKGDTSENSQ